MWVFLYLRHFETLQVFELKLGFAVFFRHFSTLQNIV